MVGLLLGNTSSVLVVQRTEGVHVNFINFGVTLSVSYSMHRRCSCKFHKFGVSWVWLVLLGNTQCLLYNAQKVFMQIS